MFLWNIFEVAVLLKRDLFFQTSRRDESLVEKKELFPKRPMGTNRW